MKSRHKSLWNQRKQNRVFRSLLEYDLGVTVDNDWNLTGSILVEDWGGFFSDPLRNKLSPKGRTLYKKLLRELSQNENLFRCKNLTEISPVAKRLLREADSTDCLTREGRILLRKEAREHTACSLWYSKGSISWTKKSLGRVVA